MNARPRMTRRWATNVTVLCAGCHNRVTTARSSAAPPRPSLLIGNKWAPVTSYRNAVQAAHLLPTAAWPPAGPAPGPAGVVRQFAVGLPCMSGDRARLASADSEPGELLMM